MTQQSVLELSTQISRNETILATDLDDEIIMMDVTSGQYFNLKEVGASVWKQLEEPKDFNTILDNLLEEFDIDRETCETEVRAFLARMAELEMISFS